MERLDGPGPDVDQFEVSLFGTGKGEAMALHLGNGQWGLIDSCRDPQTNDPATLAYLKRIGVDASAVKFIVATHWHDDHVEGIAEMLAECPGADFACSAAFTGSEFWSATFEASRLGVPIVEELRKCFTILEGRPMTDGVRPAARRVIESQTVWWRDDDAVSLYAIAPTEQAQNRAAQDVAHTLLPDLQRRKATGRVTENQASIAAVLRLPCDNVLLGGDVEEKKAAGSGWSSIILRQRNHVPKSTLFKVPHHGSNNAHHDGQWSELLEKLPIAILTPFASSRLPRRADLTRLMDRSKAVYLCGRGAEAHVGLPTSELRALRSDGVTLTTSRSIGHVRLRKTCNSGEDDWSVDHSDGAERVTRDMCLQPASASGKRGRGRSR